MPLTVVENKKLSKTTEASTNDLQVPKVELPNRPVPDSSIKYNTSYENVPSNEAYYTLFKSSDLPSSLYNNKENRVGIIEVPSFIDGTN